MNLAQGWFAFSLGVLGALGLPPAVGTGTGELIVCGGAEVFILDVRQQPPRKLWSWRAAGRPELPENMRKKFETTDDCKPVDGGRRILITSSGDGVALVERASGKVLFYASVPNAHSAEVLPRGRLVVAASIAPNQPGDRLILFDLQKPDQPLFHTAFPSAHGVVWDGGRALLWALGGDYLRSYRLAGWDTASPRLDLAAEYRLPDSDGHDLSPVPDSDLLVLTTHLHVWVFNRSQHSFSLHPQLGGEADVKCAIAHPITKQLLWMRAGKGVWWTDTLRFLGPEKTVTLKENMYKARWLGCKPGPVARSLR
jgi:hypothetical protein